MSIFDYIYHQNIGLNQTQPFYLALVDIIYYQYVTNVKNILYIYQNSVDVNIN